LADVQVGVAEFNLGRAEKFIELERVLWGNYDEFSD
jgi:hypothetical protein